MNSICGIDCSKCPYNKDCCGCEKNCASRCIAAEYIKIGGKALYDEFKNTLINEINNNSRIIKALESELDKCTSKQIDKFIRLSRVIIENIDEI